MMYCTLNNKDLNEQPVKKLNVNFKNNVYEVDEPLQ